jgi:hypothetical protein
MRYPAAGGKPVRQNASTLLWLVIFVAAVAAQRDQYIGTWSGSWEGAGSSGGFDLTLAQGKDAGLTGKVSVSGEPSYEATLAQVAFDGKKMTAKYDFTPQPEAEVLLAATFDGATATGTWTLREKASGNEVISGSWRVSKQ